MPTTPILPIYPAAAIHPVQAHSEQLSSLRQLFTNPQSTSIQGEILTTTEPNVWRIQTAVGIWDIKTTAPLAPGMQITLTLEQDHTHTPHLWLTLLTGNEASTRYAAQLWISTTPLSKRTETTSTTITLETEDLIAQPWKLNTPLPATLLPPSPRTMTLWITALSQLDPTQNPAADFFAHAAETLHTLNTRPTLTLELETIQLPTTRQANAENAPPPASPKAPPPLAVELGKNRIALEGIVTHSEEEKVEIRTALGTLQVPIHLPTETLVTLAIKSLQPNPTLTTPQTSVLREMSAFLTLLQNLPDSGSGTTLPQPFKNLRDAYEQHQKSAVNTANETAHLLAAALQGRAKEWISTLLNLTESGPNTETQHHLHTNGALEQTATPTRINAHWIQWEFPMFTPPHWQPIALYIQDSEHHTPADEFQNHHHFIITTHFDALGPIQIEGWMIKSAQESNVNLTLRSEHSLPTELSHLFSETLLSLRCKGTLRTEQHTPLPTPPFLNKTQHHRLFA